MKNLRSMIFNNFKNSLKEAFLLLLAKKYQVLKYFIVDITNATWNYYYSHMTITKYI